MKNKYIITLVLAVIIGLLGARIFYGRDNTKREGLPAVTSTTTVAKIPAGKKRVTVGGITYITDATNTAGIIIEQVPTELPKPIPALNTVVTFSATANISPEAQKIIKIQIFELVNKLKLHPEVASNWLSLGLYRKMGADYASAKIAWEYAKRLQPNDIQAYSSLGELYQYYMKEYPESELNWKKSIEIDKKFIIGYRNLFVLYTTFMKNPTQGKLILDAGLRANPESIDILVLLAQYYRDHGQTSLSRTNFEKALVQAKRQKENQNLVPQIQAEIDNLR